jgi:hypothetical protein
MSSVNRELAPGSLSLAEPRRNVVPLVVAERLVHWTGQYLEPTHAFTFTIGVTGRHLQGAI